MRTGCNYSLARSYSKSGSVIPGRCHMASTLSQSNGLYISPCVVWIASTLLSQHGPVPGTGTYGVTEKPWAGTLGPSAHLWSTTILRQVCCCCVVNIKDPFIPTTQRPNQDRASSSTKDPQGSPSPKHVCLAPQMFSYRAEAHGSIVPLCQRT